jgi:hypothetical protein
MAVKFEKTFKLDGVTSKLAMKCDLTTNNTLRVLGCIQKRGTKDRESPPACGNGFETAGLPFAKGHVIALELGGSDDRYNVVPQFEDWQGKANGAWRQMETEVYNIALPNSLMLVDITYGRTGLQVSHDQAEADFLNNKLMDWTDPRIPDQFRIRVWTSTSDPTSLHPATDTQFDALVGELGKNTPYYEKSFVLGVALPSPDRDYYVNQAAMRVAEGVWEKKKAKLGEKQGSFATFMLTEGSVAEVRKECAGDKRFTPTEANVQAAPVIMSYQKITVPQLEKKREGLKKRKIAAVTDADLGLPPTKKRKTKT